MHARGINNFLSILEVIASLEIKLISIANVEQSSKLSISFNNSSTVIVPFANCALSG